MRYLILICLLSSPLISMAGNTSFRMVYIDSHTNVVGIGGGNLNRGFTITPPTSYPIGTVFPTNSFEYWKLDASTNWVAMTQPEQDAVDQALLDESLDSSTWTAREEGLLKLIAEVGNITPREAKTKLKRHLNPTRIKKERKARGGN